VIYVVVDPNEKVSATRASMREAQEWIAEHEPDILEQNKWHIYPVDPQNMGDSARFKLKWHIKVEKFEDGQLVETIEREGED
jgi:hypothetical protein